jgi:hypothetical protein
MKKTYTKLEEQTITRGEGDNVTTHKIVRYKLTTENTNLPEDNPERYSETTGICTPEEFKQIKKQK